MSYPKRADHFKKWSQMMLEQAIVPERLEYKQQPSGRSGYSTKSVKGTNKRFRKRRKRNLRRLRMKRE